MFTDLESDIKKQLVNFLKGGYAHATFEEAVHNIPDEYLTVKTQKLPYSIWELTDHIRRTQQDILLFCNDPDYKSPAWPEGYWPVKNVTNRKLWAETVENVISDRDEFIKLIRKQSSDLFKAFSWGDGQTLFREALLIMDHTSYHTGQIILARKILNIWP